MTEWPRPTFEPLWLACKCGQRWDDWQPMGVPVDTWTAHIQTLRCPQCGNHADILLRTRPLSEKPADEQGAPPQGAEPSDRSWWKWVYKAGIKADLDKQPRTPPDHLTEAQKEVWLAGYDR